MVEGQGGGVGGGALLFCLDHIEGVLTKLGASCLSLQKLFRTPFFPPSFFPVSFRLCCLETHAGPYFVLFSHLASFYIASTLSRLKSLRSSLPLSLSTPLLRLSPTTPISVCISAGGGARPV